MKLTKNEKRAITKLLIIPSLDEYSISRFDIPEIKFNISHNSKVVIKELQSGQYLDLKFDEDKLVELIVNAKWYVEKVTITLEEINDNS